MSTKVSIVLVRRGAHDDIVGVYESADDADDECQRLFTQERLIAWSEDWPIIPAGNDGRT